jgi:hypothetical protein
MNDQTTDPVPAPEGTAKREAPFICFPGLIPELHAMVRFAMQKGKDVPPAVLNVYRYCPQDTDTPGSWQQRTDLPFSAVVESHAAMAKLVAPATPRSIRATQGKGDGGSLMDVPLLWRMMILGGISVLSYAVLTVLVDAEVVQGVFGLGIVDQLRYVAGGALGASFFALFQAHKYVVNRTFDPAFNAEYWVRYALGVISGMVLANVVVVVGNADPGDIPLTAAVVAILGGYSADAVNRILTRLVETLETFINGRNSDWLKTQQEMFKARAKARIGRQQLETVGELMGIKQRIAALPGGEEANEQLQEILDRLMTTDPEVE